MSSLFNSSNSIVFGLACPWHDGLQFLGMRPLLACLLLALFCESKCTTMSTLQGNMPAWVDMVPYSHLVNKSWEYPTDCSGFVSWALQVILNAHFNHFSTPDFTL